MPKFPLAALFLVEYPQGDHPLNLAQVPMTASNIENQIDRILKVATALRRAMEAADFSDCHHCKTLRTFPHKCCDHASSMLLFVFHEQGIHGFDMMRGTLPDWGEEGHNWIQRGEIIVDITADQFSGLKLPPVIVGRFEWHSTLTPEPEPNRLQIDTSLYKVLSDDYDRIMKHFHLPAE